MCNLAKLRFKWHSCDAIHLCTLARRMLIQILFIFQWFFLPVPLLHLNQHDVWRSQSRGGQSWSPWSEAAQTRPCCCPTSHEQLTHWGPCGRNMIYLWKLSNLEVFKIEQQPGGFKIEQQPRGFQNLSNNLEVKEMTTSSSSSSLKPPESVRFTPSLVGLIIVCVLIQECKLDIPSRIPWASSPPCWLPWEDKSKFYFCNDGNF